MVNSCNSKNKLTEFATIDVSCQLDAEILFPLNLDGILFGLWCTKNVGRFEQILHSWMVLWGPVIQKSKYHSILKRISLNRKQTPMDIAPF